MSKTYEDVLREVLRQDDPLLTKIVIQGISADIRRRATPVKLEFMDSRDRKARPIYMGFNPFDTQ